MTSVKEKAAEDDMAFVEVTAQEIELLAKALGVKMTCQLCGKCGENIMPPRKTRKLASVICDSALCLTEYFSLLNRTKRDKHPQKKTEMRK